MAEHSTIEWTDATWNPITGCTVCSPGCANCYAMKLAGTRLKNHPTRIGLTKPSKAGPVWTGEVRFNEKALLEPLKWKRPRMIFVCAHGDLFHESVPDEWIDKVFAVMALCPQHTFQVLTKRSARMWAYASSIEPLYPHLLGAPGRVSALMKEIPGGSPMRKSTGWPLPNVWLGVSAERQQEADARIPDLLATPAAVRFVSLEPLLGPIDMKRWLPAGRPARRAGSLEPFIAPHFFMTKCEHCGWLGSSELCGTDWGGDDSDVYCPSCHRSMRADDFDGHIGWVIVGGESGRGARPMHPDWARSLRDQCATANVPFFFKQHGAYECTIAAADFQDYASYDADAADIRDSWKRCEVVWPDGRRAQPGKTREWWAEQDFSSDGQESELTRCPVVMRRVGKGVAGRLLDGVEHNGMPDTQRAAAGAPEACRRAPETAEA